jgi:hypothetical protein
MSTALAIQEPQSILAVVNTAQVVKAQRDAIVALMRDAMVDGVDYGIIPGCKVPSLLKPGSEKLLSMFHLAVKPVVEDLSTPDTIRYQVHVIVSEIASGRVVGEGIGAANSAEAKYQWREAICPQEWEETPVDRRRTKWKKGRDGAYQVKQVRADMDDIDNTVLKMAKKRAQIDAVLTATGASAVFGQDLEDLSDVPPSAEEAPTQTPPTLQRKAEAPAAQRGPVSGGAVISEAQSRRFYGIWKQAGRTKEEVKGYLLEHFGVEDDRKIPVSGYEKACAWAGGQ